MGIMLSPIAACPVIDYFSIPAQTCIVQQSYVQPNMIPSPAPFELVPACNITVSLLSRDTRLLKDTNMLCLSQDVFSVQTPPTPTSSSVPRVQLPSSGLAWVSAASHLCDVVYTPASALYNRLAVSEGLCTWTSSCLGSQLCASVV